MAELIAVTSIAAFFVVAAIALCVFSVQALIEAVTERSDFIAKTCLIVASFLMASLGVFIACMVYLFVSRYFGV